MTSPTSPKRTTAVDNTTLDVTTPNESNLVVEGLVVAEGEDLVGADPASVEECTLTQRGLGGGSSGSDVICLQEALREAGYLDRNP
ncbi:MAG: hypothetical protein ACO38D_07845, partial [Ilumatobacteraceae bacterium]